MPRRPHRPTGALTQPAAQRPSAARRRAQRQRRATPASGVASRHLPVPRGRRGGAFTDDRDRHQPRRSRRRGTSTALAVGQLRPAGERSPTRPATRRPTPPHGHGRLDAAVADGVTVPAADRRQRRRSASTTSADTASVDLQVRPRRRRAAGRRSAPRPPARRSRRLRHERRSPTAPTTCARPSPTSSATRPPIARRTSRRQHRARRSCRRRPPTARSSPVRARIDADRVRDLAVDRLSSSSTASSPAFAPTIAAPAVDVPDRRTRRREPCADGLAARRRRQHRAVPAQRHDPERRGDRPARHDQERQLRRADHPLVGRRLGDRDARPNIWQAAPPAPQDFLVLHIDPHPRPRRRPATPAVRTSIVDVRMNWELAGTEEHHFDAPLQIDLNDSDGRRRHARHRRARRRVARDPGARRRRAPAGRLAGRLLARPAASCTS